MKKLFLLFLYIIASVSIALADDSGTCGDNLQWYYNSTTHELTITGSGAMTDWNYSNDVPWYSYRSEIASVNLPNELTSIGDFAFYLCSALTSVTIPNSVTSIGKDVFYGCSGLSQPIYNSHIFVFMPQSYVASTALLVGLNERAYQIPDGIEIIAGGAFYSCWYLTSVTIPNSVTSIEENAFYDCRHLTRITIPNSVTSIGDNTFSGCTRLTSATIGNGVTSIGYQAFKDCTSLTNVTIGNSVTSIGYQAFYGCTGLTSVTIPNSVTSIGTEAFTVCTGLTSVTIPNSVTSIGLNAFYGCTGLSSVTIGNSVTSIGPDAFCGCTSLTSVTWNAVNYPNFLSQYSTPFYSNSMCQQITAFTIGSDVQSIPSYLCYKMNNLTSVIIPSSVTSIGLNAFYGCTGLTSATIGNGVTSIGESAFHGCTGLTSVTIPNSVTSIEKNAFYGCTSLTSATIGNGVTSIGTEAFRGCTSLTSLIIGNSVTSIGYQAFYGCAGFSSVTIPNSVTSIDRYAFYGCTSITDVVWNAINCPNTSNNEYASPFYGISQQITAFTIGSEVQSIPRYLCYGMSNLTSVTMLAETPPTLGSSAFPLGVKIFVPCGTLEQYRSAEYNSAEYAESNYTLTVSAIQHARVCYTPYSQCEQTTQITVTPDYGYEFIRWNDGNTDNPRNVTLTQDTFFTAEIAVMRTGHCGTDNALTWTYNPETFTLTISGEGQLNENYTYGVEASQNMQHLVIEDGVTNIGSGAFYQCSTLTSVVIPNSVTSIESFAFAYCSSLINVTIPNSVSSIGRLAFNTIPNIEYNGSATGSPWGARSVNGYVDGYFVYSDASKTQLLACSSLATGEIDIPNSVSSIGELAFVDCKGITNVTIPESVTNIGNWAFQNCTILTSVIIPNGVISISNGVFYWCTGLTNVIIPNSVTSIGEWAFYHCSNLTSVMIPESVTSIGEYAFSNCVSLMSVIALMENPPVINANVFENCGDLSAIYCFVPSGSLSLYQNANVWSSFHLVGIEEAMVVAEETTATLSAPFAEGDVASYSLVLYNNGEVFCTLTLDAEGHLIGIDFAQSQQRAASSVNGLIIPITGLQPGTTYTYTLDALDSNGNIIDRHAGEFTTEGTTALENVSAGSMDNGVRKVIEDGKVAIVLPDGRKFDANGRKLR